jgi:hypothetical protein
MKKRGGRRSGAGRKTTRTILRHGQRVRLIVVDPNTDDEKQELCEIVIEKRKP